jgi:hypothetical protein
MPTLVLTPRFTEDAQALWGAAGRLGWDVERLASWRIPEHLTSIPEPVLYVEVVFAPMFAEAFEVELVEPPADWLCGVPLEYVKRRIELTTLGAARQLVEPAFVKPPNDKSFQARVYSPQELPTHLPDETPVLICEVVQWEKEFRCYIRDRKLRTFSVYLRQGELQREHEFISSDDEDVELTRFVESFLADDRVILTDGAVVDVGVIAGRGWAIVEQNAVWGAGIYGCDPAEVLLTLQRVTRRRIR